MVMAHRFAGATTNNRCRFNTGLAVGLLMGCKCTRTAWPVWPDCVTGLHSYLRPEPSHVDEFLVYMLILLLSD
jgi:hypothetical protein